ncbi:helix-turn-helix domain-containing protein [Pseudomonas serbica]|jgi:transcriptional regulator with XRE-family HTH domain|uniref:helix-turn-helix domain-containing protein n=1 Tax=Pseudomonas serbica TaxID=2965074 RepID=UPI00237BAF06|nr:helix-turn-helix transcriptional regulator [Pseudomonas serbica]
MTPSARKNELKAFGEWLSVKRALTDMTQRDVGDHVGVSWSQISRYENGEAMPRKGVRMRLQALFESHPVRQDNFAAQQQDSSTNASAILALEQLAESLQQKAADIQNLAAQMRQSGNTNLLIAALTILRGN